MPSKIISRKALLEAKHILREDKSKELDLTTVSLWIGIGSAIGGNIGLVGAIPDQSKAAMGVVCGILLGGIFGALISTIIK